MLGLMLRCGRRLQPVAFVRRSRQFGNCAQIGGDHHAVFRTKQPHQFQAIHISSRFCPKFSRYMYLICFCPNATVWSFPRNSYYEWIECGRMYGTLSAKNRHMWLVWCVCDSGAFLVDSRLRHHIFRLINKIVEKEIIKGSPLFLSSWRVYSTKPKHTCLWAQRRDAFHTFLIWLASVCWLSEKVHSFGINQINKIVSWLNK